MQQEGIMSVLGPGSTGLHHNLHVWLHTNLGEHCCEQCNEQDAACKEVEVLCDGWGHLDLEVWK
jgi:hypothetical protein